MHPRSRFIEGVHVIEPVAGEPLHTQHLPDGRTILIFRSLDGGRNGDVTVMGPRTHAHFKVSTNLTRAVVIRLKPGWSSQILGSSIASVTNDCVHLHEFWGQSDLCPQLLASSTADEVLERFSDAIDRASQRTSEPISARLARRAAHLLETDEVRVDHAADRLGVSARHLRRAFNENIGVSPKEYARSVRLQRAVRLATGSSDLGRIAVDAGYYDQAHLNRDFRELIGRTPGDFLKRSAVHAA